MLSIYFCEFLSNKFSLHIKRASADNKSAEHCNNNNEEEEEEGVIIRKHGMEKAFSTNCNAQIVAVRIK